MLLLFSFLASSIKIIITESNVDEFNQKSATIPAFILFYSPYCGHCTRVHPDWIRFMDLYEKDPDIIVGEVDCVNQRSAAKSIYQVNGYPSFIYILGNTKEEKRVTRTVEAFTKMAEEIKASLKNSDNPKSTCLNFNENDLTNYRYPIFVSNEKVNDVQTCEKLKQLSESTNVHINLFYIDVSQRYQSRIMLSANKFVLVPENSELSVLSNYVKQFMVYQQFGDWSILRDEVYNSIKEFRSRRIALFVSNQESQRNEMKEKYLSISLNEANNFIMNQVNVLDLNKKLPQPITIGENGTLIVSTNGNENFYLIQDIMTKDFQSLLNELNQNPNQCNLGEKIAFFDQPPINHDNNDKTDENKSGNTDTQNKDENHSNNDQNKEANSNSDNNNDNNNNDDNNNRNAQKDEKQEDGDKNPNDRQGENQGEKKNTDINSTSALLLLCVILAICVLVLGLMILSFSRRNLQDRKKLINNEDQDNLEINEEEELGVENQPEEEKSDVV
ncbi:hypothetical protein TRFO_34075 [Tritrichomonas foetus]|uniref:Thioredoxin domain-containing protein n=1 Tax=Tritrichomonas foetus TaxID=1144522 RepID=A0A1J4JQI1_9EUKA|nr:hypothetical protein TRFO_34075 [Tritrichomonas foetus]|eukprot:OHS99492.1 hypothetical protein TRFO_34075 [Tritrichomonas foetus]